MYYAQVRLGFRVIRKEFPEIEDARRYVKDWCYRYPYSKFTPSVGCDGKLTEYIIRLDKEVVSTDLRHKFHTIQKDGSLSETMAIPL